MSSWHSYPSIYNLGHRALTDLFSGGLVLVQEKVDGSQFSFGLIDGVVRFRSKGRKSTPRAASLLCSAKPLSPSSSVLTFFTRDGRIGASIYRSPTTTR
jgi:hypothetical protein